MKPLRILLVCCLILLFSTDVFARWGHPTKPPVVKETRISYEVKVQDTSLSVKERQTLWQKMIKLFGYFIP